ncbi:MAG: tetratricopeptide repeat protein [Desulfobacterales bacterium]|nr:tetratricopeptide repeat protein [Desulfobacterales bacterium]
MAKSPYKPDAIRWYWIILLVGVTLAVYAPVMDGNFVWDDDQYVQDNANLRSTSGLVRIWTDPSSNPQYYPLVFTSFWLEYRLWGSQPLGFHLTNVLLHVVNAILVWVVLSRLNVPGARIAAFIFALHPVHVESVAWITERKNVLSGLFFLLALLASLKAFNVHSPDRSKSSRQRKTPFDGVYLFSLGLFLCGLLSKTVTSVLPVLLVLILWWKNRRIRREDLVRLVPFFLLSAVFGLVTVWMERVHVGAAGQGWNLDAVERILVAGRAMWFYAAKLVWPHPLIFMYPRWTVDAGSVWQYLYPAGILAGATVLWCLRRRLGLGPFVALAAFAVGLFPALGFIDFYLMRFSFVADHFQYLASIAPIAVFGAGARGLLNRAGRPARLLETGGCLLLCGLLAFLVVQEGKKFSGLEFLWRDTLTKNPGCWAARNNLGDVFKKRGDFDEAEAHYAEAVKIHPGFFEGRNNLGLVLARNGQLVDSATHLSRAAALEPGRADVRNNLAAVLVQLGKFEKAAVQYAEAIRLDPDFAEAHNNLGLLKVRQQRYAEAVHDYLRALAIEPRNPEVLNNLGYVMALQQRFEQAAVYFDRALTFDPRMEKARNNLNLARKILEQRSVD